MSDNNFVLIITGPTGVGKTTLCKLVAEKFGYKYISGDETKKELFPGLENIILYPEKLEIVKNELLKRIKEMFNKKECVVVDYVILGEDYINKFKKLFGKNLIFKVIQPSVETTIERDKKRECWTSGDESVKRLYKDFEESKNFIGEENYIDNSNETPQETFDKYFNKL